MTLRKEILEVLKADQIMTVEEIMQALSDHNYLSNVRDVLQNMWAEGKIEDRSFEEYYRK